MYCKYWNQHPVMQRLSPLNLLTRRQQQQQPTPGRRRIRYMHALGEATGLPDACQVRDMPPAILVSLVTLMPVRWRGNVWHEGRLQSCQGAARKLWTVQ